MFVVVARAAIVFVLFVVAERADVRVVFFLFVLLGVKIEIGRTERGATVVLVLSGVRDVIVRVARAVVCCVLLVRDVLFSARLAAPAPNVHTTSPKIKSKIFFISA